MRITLRELRSVLHEVADDARYRSAASNAIGDWKSQGKQPGKPNMLKTHVDAEAQRTGLDPTKLMNVAMDIIKADRL